jgi:chromosome segregation ATPase
MAEVFGRKRVRPLTKGDISQAKITANKKLANRKIVLNEEIKVLESSLKKLSDTFKSREKDLKILEKSIASYKSENSDLNNKNNLLKKVSSSLNNEIKDLKLKDKALNESSSKSAKLEEKSKKQADILQSEVSSLEGQKNSLNNDLKKLKSVIDKDTKDYESFKGSAESKLASFKSTFKSKEEKIDKLNNNYESLQSSIDALTLERNMISSSLKDIESNIAKKEDDHKNKMLDREMESSKRMVVAGAKLKVINQSIEKGQKELFELETKKTEERKKLEDMIAKMKEYKVNFMEEIAAMKLKFKIDKIDKAGLKEVFDG